MLSCLQTKCIVVKIQGVFVTNSTMSLGAHVPYCLNVGDPVEKGLGGKVCSLAGLRQDMVILFSSQLIVVRIYILLWMMSVEVHYNNYRYSLFLILGQCSDFSLELVRASKPYKVEPLLSIVVFLQG